jgi:hypothetical protein
MVVCEAVTSGFPEVRREYRREYRRRQPETTLLHQVVSEHLEPFLARAGELADGRGLPRFVERELRAYLKCGILAHGFVRVRCDACGKDALVAFSCKGRGFCPSCGGRRMASTAAHLVDRVLPRVPFRQWVLSLPIQLRYRIAFDRELCRRVRNIFVRAVLGFLRRRGQEAGVSFPEVGSVTAVQRFGGALNLNVHFHTLAFDGVFRRDLGGGDFRFVPLEPPDEEELKSMVARIRSRILSLLRRRGSGAADAEDAAAAEPMDSPSLGACAAASLLHRVPLGPSSGLPIARRRRLQLKPTSRITVPKDGCADVDGFSLHANVRIAARDRGRLERLCNYLVRPPISDARLALTEDGRIALELKTPYSDGTTHFVFDPMTFLARLAALVPPPHAHLVVYHGVLASAASVRSWIVPRVASASLMSDEPAVDRVSASSPRPRNYTWAELMKRVFLLDVLRCPCGGARRLLAVITVPEVILAILRCLGLSESMQARGPPDPPPSTGPVADPASEPLEVRLVLE